MSVASNELPGVELWVTGAGALFGDPFAGPLGLRPAVAPVDAAAEPSSDDAGRRLERWLIERGVAGRGGNASAGRATSGAAPQHATATGASAAHSARDAPDNPLPAVDGGSSALAGDALPHRLAAPPPIPADPAAPGGQSPLANGANMADPPAGSTAGSAIAAAALDPISPQRTVRTAFRANDGTHGYELWVTDGTAAGTYLLDDINPGPGNSYAQSLYRLSDGKVIFRAYDVTYGDELWVTNGTAGGTYMVKDINPGPVGSRPHEFASLGDGRVVFRCFDGTHGEELWVTDGTSAGTMLVDDINPGPASSFSQSIHAYLTALGDGKVLFTANDGTHGFQLWVTDGTTAGTMMVDDIDPTPPSPGLRYPVAYGPRYLVALDNSRVLFSANDGTHGYQLWVSDGTAAGTMMVDDMNPSPAGYGPRAFTPVGNGKAVFIGNDGVHGYELWVTDGTTAGTMLLDDINPGRNGSVGNKTGFSALGNGKVVFDANDGVHGYELWVTDGTAAGTMMVKDINPGPASSITGHLDWRAARSPFAAPLGNGTAVFSANDGVHGYELWITDGTAAGTMLLDDINPGPGSSTPGYTGPGTHAAPSDQGLYALGNGTAEFSANDGVHGYQLWITDGTTAGTRMVDAVNPSGNAFPSSFTDLLPPASRDFNGDENSDILWRASNGNVAVWEMNGTAIAASGLPGFADPASWTIRGTGDFNGDGKADILWRDASGNVAVWQMNGTSVTSTGIAGFADPTAWTIVATGDFNGDGKSDLLWRRTNGNVGIWLMNGASISANGLVGFADPTVWTIRGTGDFNGDGRSDILWQDSSGNVDIWEMNGLSVTASAIVGFADPASWHIRGTGDFNGDGRSDILWQDNSGDVAIWEMNGFSIVANPIVGFADPTNWHIRGTGDYNGDGKSDILWQDNSGDVAVWEMNGASILASGLAGFASPASWAIVPPDNTGSITAAPASPRAAPLVATLPGG